MAEYKENEGGFVLVMEKKMNAYIKNLNRIEFVVTLACTGRCKHCSEGDHIGKGEHIDGDIAANAVREIAENFNIQSLMTFGGEPLLYPNTVYKIHTAAREKGIPARQIITNGFFSKKEEKIREVAQNLIESGVNKVLLSVDAFHQETIPLDPVKRFATAIQASKSVELKVHPAWLGGKEIDNIYNRRTREILREFEDIGIAASEGNDIFPEGNALKYLGQYFDLSKSYVNQYQEDKYDIRTIPISANGDVLGGNLYKTDILEILQKYDPNRT